MGYRLVVAICALFLVTSCAAFDSDTDAIEGFGDEDQQGMPTVGKEMGPLSGYYVGKMVLESNDCQSVSDETGVEADMEVDLVQDENTLNATFEDTEKVLTATLKVDKAVFLDTVMNVRHIYYFEFADDKATGGCEVVEADEAGDYGNPCASYTIDLEKGEKPVEEEAAEEGEEDAADDSAEDAEASE